MHDRSIMLVEDNPDDEALTLRALKMNHILNDIVIARDGQAAVDMLLGDDSRPLPQLVLLDLKLPKLDGLEVLRRIRQHPRTSTLPVVILTTSREESDLVASYDLNVNSYIRKPVDFEHFTEAVRQMGAYWLLLNQTPDVP